MTELASKSIAETKQPLSGFEWNYAPDLFAARCLDDQQTYANVLGVKVSAIDMKRAVDLADRWIAAGCPGYACVTAVHVVMEAQRDRRYLQILNRAAYNLPDGMPLSWVGWLQGRREMDRVDGPGFMLEMCKLSVERGYRNFFYGGEPGVAERLRESFQMKFPGLQVVGTYSPPFRSLTPIEARELIERVQRVQPHIVWVGLGAPKQ